MKLIIYMPALNEEEGISDVIKSLPKKIEGIDFEANIKQIPIGQIVVETDAPYLSPPMAPDRNEPIYLKYIVEEIARIKGMGYERVEEATTENALKLFDLNEI